MVLVPRDRTTRDPCRLFVDAAVLRACVEATILDPPQPDGVTLSRRPSLRRPNRDGTRCSDLLQVADRFQHWDTLYEEPGNLAANDLNLFASVFDNLFTNKQFDSKGLTIEALSTEEAYKVQQLVIQNRCQRGERAVGYKIGCTSAPIRKQFGLSEPICGRVMEPHVEYGSTELETNHYLEPAIEPEFVLTIGKDIMAVPESDKQLLNCIDYVSPGIELHHFKFHFGAPTLQELIASNGIHAGLVMGQERFDPRRIDWQMEGVGVFRGNDLIASGIAADILGGPLKSLRWLIGHLVAQGSGLKAGDIVIPGSAVELVRVKVGDRITARFTHAGSVTATFV